MESYALLSVSDKTGISGFASGLKKYGFTILSTGGTAAYLQDQGIDVVNVEDFTGFPEILEGRVKTLHPYVHGGLLYKRGSQTHSNEVDEHGIKAIDIVAVNLYPFEATVLKGAPLETVIENIDIGGPAMIRSGSKNFDSVAVVVHPVDYDVILEELATSGITYETRRKLAAKAFSHTAVYDSIIAGYLNETAGIKFPLEFTLPGRLTQLLRYGENPHQEAAFYTVPLSVPGLESFKQLHGKELSFNNIADTNAALELVREFNEPAAVIIKHMNPCGAATGASACEAYEKALECDPTSAFGGIAAFNKPVDEELAEKLSEIFLEVIVAPDFTQAAIDKLSDKKNLRLLSGKNSKFFDNNSGTNLDIKKVQGGFLLQEPDAHSFESLEGLYCPTKRIPTDREIESMLFAWTVAKHVKSNAIVYAKGTSTVGIGAGQMSRIDSSKIAGSKARSPLEGAVMASDAFFPFSDSIDEAAALGITAVVSPGGSIRDNEVIEAANRAGIALIFTKIRHFKH